MREAFLTAASSYTGKECFATNKNSTNKYQRSRDSKKSGTASANTKDKLGPGKTPYSYYNLQNI